MHCSVFGGVLRGLDTRYDCWRFLYRFIILFNERPYGKKKLDDIPIIYMCTCLTRESTHMRPFIRLGLGHRAYHIHHVL